MNKKDYEARLSEAQALNKEELQELRLPIGIYLQEAEDLYHRAAEDKKQLLGAGLPETTITDLPSYIGACREAQSLWAKEQESRQDATKEWQQRAPQAENLRSHLLHAFEYAFREDTRLLGNLDRIREGSGNADMIQDLNDLAVLGRSQPELLQAIHLEATLLDEAARQSDELATLLSKANSDREGEHDNKQMRDRMYTLLKTKVDAIRLCGRYVFWKDKKLVKQYGSRYERQLRLRRARNNKREENALR